jgi:type III restriction enzyme
MTVTLKHYQEQTLAILTEYLQKARIHGPEVAYAQSQRLYPTPRARVAYQPLEGLETVPYICLRLPTGGGKTLLSAHTVALANQHYLERPKPLVLLLVPTTTIKDQTKATLIDPNHANHKALVAAFGAGNVRVLGSEDFTQLRPYDLETQACIIVATFAALRVESTEGRKVYAHNEHLEPFFTHVPKHTAGLERNEAGDIKCSFANLLYLHRPLVIVDEAHNAKTDLSTQVLQRVNAACVVEYTATPASNSNVIVSVSAAQLKAEAMIKLPIVLNESATWEDAVHRAVETRKTLHKLAERDKDYLRPIVLFQAESKDRPLTVDVLRQHLMDNEGIPAEHIAIATGDQKELDGINLFDPTCPICYVITVQALREGWDCSFAYVLCSVANTKSPTVVEQLLGRVLRMPYAQRRTQAELNQGYAHVSSQSWPQATLNLHDRLVNMGFEKQEALEAMTPDVQLPLFGDNDELPALPFTHVVEAPPDLATLTKEEASYVRVETLPTGMAKVVFQPDTPTDLLAKVTQALPLKKDRDHFSRAVALHTAQQTAKQAPFARGEELNVPQLCLFTTDGTPVLAEKEACLGDDGWDLLVYSTVLDANDFEVKEDGKTYLADIENEKVTITYSATEQLTLTGIYTDMDEGFLCLWLANRLRHRDTLHPTLNEFLRRCVNNLLNRGDMDLVKLNRGKYVLEKVLRDKIKGYRDHAYAQGVQSTLFGDGSRLTIVPDFTMSFRHYPHGPLYEGPYKFKKHYFNQIGSLNGEEVECAKALDEHPMVVYWVRNIERQREHSFSLPTSSDRFYPDFVAKLQDDTLLVVEYKGADRSTSDDTKEKDLIGKQWAKVSGHKFLMALKKDERGYDVATQIAVTLKS